MYILGLNVGHNGTACLLKEGEVVGCVSEERFSRIKNHSGMPLLSIKYLLDENKISISDLDLIVSDNNYAIEKDAYFGKRFLEAYTKKSRKKKILSKLGYNYPNLFNTYLKFKEVEDSAGRKSRAEKLRVKLSSILSFPKEKIKIIDHHLAHAYSTCFNLNKNKKTLIFTLDGEGNGLCATVNIFDGKNMKVISRTSKSASLGYLYSTATIFLGMKPLEHEFKVMGLAPYAKKHGIDKIYPRFKNLLWVDDELKFHSKFSMPFADYFFNKEMKHERFDNLAGAVQRLVEELTAEWIEKGINKTGIKNIALAGGVFMNVKANQKISELNSVNSLFVMPSCGDESNAIGSAFYGYLSYCKSNSIQLNCKPIENLYLGPEYSDKYIESLVKQKYLNKKYKITRPKDITLKIAKLLANGEIVSRCSGKSEWGARALGNRSILANPKDPDTIKVLNETIKDRDFWMPFTPSIIYEDEKRYVINPKKIEAKFMVITFNSTKQARTDLPAAMHPYDFTLRPQIVKKKDNPDYHQIIKYFKKFTGIGGILNTSFNLHGEPNVLTPEDALRTVENSSLKYLAMGSYLFEKKEN